MNQTTRITSRIMILIEGSSLTINQWGDKVRDRELVLARYGDSYHWASICRTNNGTSAKDLVDDYSANKKQKIWYAIFDSRD